ncbi:hypothetical protein [Hymenobacter ruricola]|uniref:Uncharacterized protein n=1 Tax=Hymenobacter ruricola TaxID=2791023 RepID=A0ABS0I777_9BACT|nr:hypothetical protein [Hymenobacter ruricola]MBF9222407.1 hypothetical protein [Hymenobacter ruricola]
MRQKSGARWEKYAANGNKHDLGTGYDNLEVHLNGLVQTITEGPLK